MSSKKGMLVMSLSLIVVMLIALAIFYVQISGKTYAYTSAMGKVQGTMLQYQNDAQKSLLYIDQAARFASQDSIFSLYEQEGFSSPPECNQGNGDARGTFWESIALNDETKKPANRDKQNLKDSDFSCYPTVGSLKANVKYIFNRNLDFYLEKAPEKNLPLDNYDFIFVKNPGSITLKGIPARNLFFPSFDAWNIIQLARKQGYKDGVIESLSADEQECLKKQRQYPFVKSNEYASQYTSSCVKCPKVSSCSVYRKEQHCIIDPCGFNCYWGLGKCREFSDVVYTVKPSFAVSVGEDFFGRFEKIVSAVSSYKSKFIGCIIQGGLESTEINGAGQRGVNQDAYRKVTSPTDAGQDGSAKNNLAQDGAGQDGTYQNNAQQGSSSTRGSMIPGQEAGILAGNSQKSHAKPDAEECIGLLKKEKDFAALDVAASQQQESFALGFTFPLTSYSHPYRSEKPVMNIGLQFWDVYPPAKVPSFKQENDLLVWSLSPSSDIGKYHLFAMEKGQKDCGPGEKYVFFADLTPEVSQLDPVDYFISNLGNIIGKPEIGIVDDKQYCFTIAPEDYAGNIGEAVYGLFAITQPST